MKISSTVIWCNLKPPPSSRWDSKLEFLVKGWWPKSFRPVLGVNTWPVLGVNTLLDTPKSNTFYEWTSLEFECGFQGVPKKRKKKPHVTREQLNSAGEHSTLLPGFSPSALACQCSHVRHWDLGETSYILKREILHTTMEFKLTFLPPSWRSLGLSKGHLTIPTRSQRLAR